MVQEELKDIYEDSFIYLRYPGVPWDTLGYPGAPWGIIEELTPQWFKKN